MCCTHQLSDNYRNKKETFEIRLNSFRRRRVCEIRDASFQLFNSRFSSTTLMHHARLWKDDNDAGPKFKFDLNSNGYILGPFLFTLGGYVNPSVFSGRTERKPKKYLNSEEIILECVCVCVSTDFS